MKKMTIKKLSGHDYAQAQVVITDKNDIYLISYQTTVIELTRDGWLTCSGLYSRTTMKHIGWFMCEYIEWPNGKRGDYQTARDAYKGGYHLNVNTGEIIKI